MNNELVSDIVSFKSICENFSVYASLFCSPALWVFRASQHQLHPCRCLAICSSRPRVTWQLYKTPYLCSLATCLQARWCSHRHILHCRPQHNNKQQSYLHRVLQVYPRAALLQDNPGNRLPRQVPQYHRSTLVVCSNLLAHTFYHPCSIPNLARRFRLCSKPPQKIYCLTSSLPVQPCNIRQMSRFFRPRNAPCSLLQPTEQYRTPLLCRALRKVHHCSLACKPLNTSHPAQHRRAKKIFMLQRRRVFMQ